MSDNLEQLESSQDVGELPEATDDASGVVYPHLLARTMTPAMGQIGTTSAVAEAVKSADDCEAGIQATRQAREDCRKKMIDLIGSAFLRIHALQQDKKNFSSVQKMRLRLDGLLQRFDQEALLKSSRRERKLSENERLLQRLSIENMSIFLALQELKERIPEIMAQACGAGSIDELVPLQDILDGIEECMNILQAN